MVLLPFLKTEKTNLFPQGWKGHTCYTKIKNVC
jgi:hypothetical protein